ncbi:hypothetical protein GKZ90_0009115 [Flavobacterium sp. MC2016-06]|jgi:hypothetical protein|uniref:hypothetical protein n=1 Tax=Flavobacterium sp. MC2016-06 TaxID=2676308 RepID=UPI0012BA803B|nr:hypothetical protein [Flavobacterium sp. MC2016-06]MBU3859376.1 hypothetical protein [Flavobacterium sp. MC2016-06]
MGIFDFFKKNKTKENEILENKIVENEEISASIIDRNGKSLNEIYAEKREIKNIEKPNALFESIKIYNEYIVRFIGMQMQNNYAPIAAYEKANGEIIGYLYLAKDMSYNLSIGEVVSNMKIEFEKRMNEKSIKSYAIFYHSKFNDDNDHSIANRDGEFNAISVQYKFEDNLSGFIGMPYLFEEDQIIYKGFSKFSKEQNNFILNTQLIEDKNYFQETITIEAQIIENEAGLKIKKVNNGTVGDMWGGIFGFERLSQEDGKNFLTHTAAFILFQEAVKSNDEVLISEVKHDAVIFRGAKTIDEESRTAFPVIKTDFFIDVVNKQINEWDNVNNLEAIIIGGGRDTFGLTFFATDYAINSAKYKSTKNLNIELSGIIYTLEIGSLPDTTPDGPNYSEGFTMYMPNKEMSELGCFDFIGQLEDFREIEILYEKPVKGYILKIRLITNEDHPDFFTIEMFVNKENMRFENLEIGMKLTGLFQLQGQIKE